MPIAILNWPLKPRNSIKHRTENGKRRSYNLHLAGWDEQERHNAGDSGGALGKLGQKWEPREGHWETQRVPGFERFEMGESAGDKKAAETSLETSRKPKWVTEARFSKFHARDALADKVVKVPVGNNW